MSSHGGKRRGAGRKAGDKNKRTSRLIEAIDKQLATKEGQIEPLDIFNEIMNTPEPKPSDYGCTVTDDGNGPLWVQTLEYIAARKAWADLRMDAAKAAAPYRHARLAASEQGSALPDHEDFLKHRNADKSEA